MASRPAKRQRRSTIVHSDDDSNDSKPPTPRKQKPKNGSTTASPKTTPEKTRKAPKKAAVPNKSLHSFFGRATEEQRWKRDSATPEVDTGNWIEDDISDEEEIKGSPMEGTSVTSSFSTRHKQEISFSSQKFVKPPIPSRPFSSQPLVASAQPEDEEQPKPWSDRYGPDTLDELAVHKRKVGDVQNWLRDTLAGRERKRLLILKGPAGSGKTSTITLLAKSLGVKTVPWHNSTVYEAGLASNIQQFQDFLNRGGGFGSLSFHNDTENTATNQDGSSRILLVEEFPTVTNQASSTQSSFRSIVLQYLASSSHTMKLGVASLSSYPPLVMLISETLLSSSTALNDSFTAHRLLGPDICNHPMTTMMEFNPVATTFVQKALDLVVKKEARDSKRRRTPGPAVLQKLAEIGDLRSAINSLEFLCARGDEDGNWSGTVAGRPKKKDAVPLSEMEKNALQLVGQRESTLDMFHAAGKIVYNKREDPRVLDTRAEPPPKPPDHLLYLYTPKASQVDVDALLSETGTDIQTFISTLHENYVLSCNGDDFVDSLDGCADILSDSDVLNPESRSMIRGRSNANRSNFSQSGNSDMLRQDEISFQTACLGLLFHLPFPVSRAVPSGARKQDAFKMFYPGSLRLWKPTEEIDDLITMYMNTGVNSSGQLSQPTAIGVSSWRSRGFGIHHTQGQEAQDKDIDMNTTSMDGVKQVTSRNAYVLEILPYMAKIKASASRGSNQPYDADQQNLKKITQIRGLNLVSSDPPDEETQSPPSPSLPSRTSGAVSLGRKIQAAHDSIARLRGSVSSSNTSGKSSGMIVTSSQAVTDMDKLYISDDDISD